MIDVRAVESILEETRQQYAELLVEYTPLKQREVALKKAMRGLEELIELKHHKLSN